MKNWLRHFDQLSAVFTGVKECEIWPRFEGSGFEREQHMGNLLNLLLFFLRTHVCIFSFLIHATIIWWIKMYKQQLWVCDGFCVLPELDIVRSSQLPRTTYSPPPWKTGLENSVYWIINVLSRGLSDCAKLWCVWVNWAVEVAEVLNL